MSGETDYYRDPSDATVALFLENNDANELTDLLVAALDQALRILEDEAPAETMH